MFFEMSEFSHHHCHNGTYADKGKFKASVHPEKYYSKKAGQKKETE
jgi:hypothetical protein